MKKSCVFKAWGGSVWVRVLACRKTEEAPVVFRVMIGRCYIDSVRYYERLDEAVDKALSLVRADVSGNNGGCWV